MGKAIQMDAHIYVNGRYMTPAEFQAAKGLSVGGGLSLVGCTGLASLPDGLSVGGSLYLTGCTGLASLPDGLSVGGALDLRGCTGLTALPEGLSVGVSLYLGGCTGLTNVCRPGSATGIGDGVYETFGARLSNGVRVLRGCRNFSPAEAREHWAKKPEILAHIDEIDAFFGS